MLPALSSQKGSLSHSWVCTALWSPAPDYLNTGNHLVWAIQKHTDTDFMCSRTITQHFKSNMQHIFGHGIYFGYLKITWIQIYLSLQSHTCSFRWLFVSHRIHLVHFLLGGFFNSFFHLLSGKLTSSWLNLKQN